LQNCAVVQNKIKGFWVKSKQSWM